MLLHANARAGLLAETAKKLQLDAAIVTGNGIGIAVQGATHVSGTRQAVFANVTQNLLSDQGLALPSLPPPITLGAGPGKP